MRRKKIKIKLGTVVEIRDGKYSSARGAVTECFDDTIQLYGLDNRGNVGFHEVNCEDILSNKPTDKERLRADIIRELRRMESKKILAEVKFRELERDIAEAHEKTNVIFGAKP